MALKYIDPTRFIPGVPARDLTDEEVEQFGGEQVLIDSGLYAKPQPSKSKKAGKK